MYLAIDVGGTKTLLAVFSDTGEILARQKILTSRDYSQFLDNIKSILDNEFKNYQFSACCCALPGIIDRQHGMGIRFGNLPWRNIAIVNDLKSILNNSPVFFENDAKLGGLSEALPVLQQYQKVLYITLGTGIGGAVILKGRIDPAFYDFEPGRTVLEHDGKLKKWEELASGHALSQLYGKQASEINDPKIWDEFAYNVALGLAELLTILMPDVVIIGGGIGTYFGKFQTALNQELQKFKNDMTVTPPITKAKRPEEAVIYGCFEFIKQHN